jgi:hypothetical protein
MAGRRGGDEKRRREQAWYGRDELSDEWLEQRNARASQHLSKNRREWEWECVVTGGRGSAGTSQRISTEIFTGALPIRT